MGHEIYKYVHSLERTSLNGFSRFPPTCAALDGPDGGGGARGRVAPPVDGRDARLLLLLRAAFLYGAHVTVTPHAEAAGHGQVQGIHRLGLQLTEHRLAHGLDLPIHLHLAHLQTRKHPEKEILCKNKLMNLCNFTVHTNPVKYDTPQPMIQQL